MNYVSMCNTSRKKTKEDIENKRLVQILNSKIFKGYRQIKSAKTFGKNDLKFIKTRKFEVEELQPFDDNYNLQYKKEYLNKCKYPLTYNPFSIQHLSSSRVSHQRLLTLKSNKLRKNNKSKEKDELKLTSPFFSMTETNELANQEAKREMEKRKQIYHQLFRDNKYVPNQYYDLPFFIIEKKNSQFNNEKEDRGAFSSHKAKRGCKIPNEEEIQNDTNENEEYSHLNQTQFLYKISRRKKPFLKPQIYTKTNGLKKGFIMRRRNRPATGLNDYKQVTIKVTNENKDNKNHIVSAITNRDGNGNSRTANNPVSLRGQLNGKNMNSTQATSTEKNKEYRIRNRALPNDIRYVTDQATVDKLRKKKEMFQQIKHMVFDKIHFSDEVKFEMIRSQALQQYFESQY